MGCTTGRESHPALKILDSISGSIIAWYITECKPFLKPGQNRDGTTFRRRALSRGLAPSSSLSFCQSFHRVFLQAAESDVFSNASLPHGRQNRLIIPPVKKNRAFPTGNALFLISLSYVDFGRVRPYSGVPPVFVLILHPFCPTALLRLTVVPSYDKVWDVFRWRQGLHSVFRRIQKIRTLLLSEKSSDFVVVVHLQGLEPWAH